DCFTKKGKISELKSSIPEQYRDANQVQKEVNLLQTKVNNTEKENKVAIDQYEQKQSLFVKASATLEEKQKQLSKQQLSTTEAHQQWLEALTNSQFNDELHYKASLMLLSEQQQLKKKIENFEQQIQLLRGAVKQLKDSLKDKKLPDLNEIETRLNAAEQHYKVVEQDFRTLDARRNALKQVKSKLNDAHTKNQQLEEEYKIFGTLSDVANGQTGSKISLQRFVLSVLLDDVLIQASQRLSLMTSGRYELVRHGKRVKGNKATGLELEVIDSYSGSSRSVATLSGGESFMAALSLALGLSDVVQSYAGGIRLDTLFIDEGFGSLDTQALDNAVKTLMDLQASGRMIGVISHVSELKEQMALRLDVISSRNGSHISVCSA
ncbi:MAG: SMC family ATPase, partial [Gammaproteobacteria bacterium]|nr:SMC family ATPase [Gammaproteobacteria bacterium]